MKQNEPTTIIWVRLRSKDNRGAAIVKVRLSTEDSCRPGRLTMNYLLGDTPPRYPMPVVVDRYHPSYWLFEYDFFI